MKKYSDKYQKIKDKAVVMNEFSWDNMPLEECGIYGKILAGRKKR